MKISTLSIVTVLAAAGISLGGCKLYNNDNANTACAGYLGCSAQTTDPIGINTNAAAGPGAVRPAHKINLGCGKQLPADQQNTVPGTPKGYTHFTVMGTGETLLANIPTKAGPRTFWVRVPVDYDPMHKYRVVYIGQGCGGYKVANSMTLQLFKEASGGTEQAIYVALDIPEDMANQDCYDNRDGPSSQEWEAFDLFQTFIDENYCVDNDRVYVSGYSTGGWLTNMWGCYFSGDGEHPWNGTPGTVPVPMSSSVGGTQFTSRASSVGDGGAQTDALVSDAGSSGAAGAGTAGAGGSSGAAGAGAAGAGAAGSGAAGSGDSGGGASDAGTDGPVYMPGKGPRKFAREYHIRAQAGVSGGEPDNNPPCNGPIAAIWIHDLMDSNAYAANHTVALSRVMKMNGCYKASPPTAPWHEDIMGKGVCVQYTDCPAAYPVVFCTTTMYGHGDQHERAVPGFKIFFDELETAGKLNNLKP